MQYPASLIQNICDASGVRFQNQLISMMQYPSLDSIPAFPGTQIGVEPGNEASNTWQWRPSQRTLTMTYNLHRYNVYARKSS